jgi:2-isopropylmalate synthase
MDLALRSVLDRFYPQLADVRLVDYKVRVLTSTDGTGSVVRVLIQSSDGSEVWGTVGVSPNIIHASWNALADALVYKLVKDGVEPYVSPAPAARPSQPAPRSAAK